MPAPPPATTAALPPAPPPESGHAATVAQVAFRFLLLGLTAFGGPAAHVALMEEQFVRRRRWLSRQEFLDFVGLVALIPGPNSTELAMLVGRRAAGAAGFWAAGVCFILPAAILSAGCAWAYVRSGDLPAVGGMLAGVTPVIVAVVLQALAGFAPRALRHAWLIAVAAAVALAAAAGARELPLLAAAAGIGLLVGLRRPAPAPPPPPPAPTPPPPPDHPPAARSLAPVWLLIPLALPASISSVLLAFLKIGALLFGSGYVLLAFLRTEFVLQRGWLTEQQLLDAVAVGQTTPGPLFSAATFIGYLAPGPAGHLGLAGAAAATVGIFLPAFVLAWFVGPLAGPIRRSPTAAAALDAVNAASVALMAVVALRLAAATLVTWHAWAIALTALALLLALRVNSVWLILAAGLLGAATLPR